jgi:hypothetical protein
MSCQVLHHSYNQQSHFYSTNFYHDERDPPSFGKKFTDIDRKLDYSTDNTNKTVRPLIFYEISKLIFGVKFSVLALDQEVFSGVCHAI